MEFFGLLGERLGHSLSPEIHKSILNKSKIEGAYKLFEIPKDNLEDFVNSIKLLKIKGFNITIPYKEKIVPYLDEISDEAKRIGAINTVVLRENKLYGYNTDYFGIDIMLRKKEINVEDKNIVILGSGGASKAMLTYALDNNVNKVYLVSRNPRIINLSIYDDRVSLIDYTELEKLKGDIIINTTPVGMYPNKDISPISREVIKKYDILVDLIYNPTETMFLQMGKEQGKTVVGGLSMLIGQAVKAQEIYNNINIEDRVIDEIYEEISREF